MLNLKIDYEVMMAMIVRAIAIAIMINLLTVKYPVMLQGIL